jgi:hypothetical protein
MVSVSTFVLLLALQQPADARPAPRQGLSWAEADSLTRKIASIEKRKAPPAGRAARSETVLVTEGELNSYLNLSVASDLPPGLSDVQVRLESGRVHARGEVDLERVRSSQAGSNVQWRPLAFLGGSVPIELSGRLSSADGFGTVQIEEVRLASLPVPISVLDQLVSASTRTASDPDGFDIQSPFRLPYSLRRVRVEPGRIYLDF